MLTLMSALAKVGDDDLTSMPVKRVDEDMAQPESTVWKYWCHGGENVCPRSYRFIDHHDGTCSCFFFSGSWKRDTDLGPPQKDESRVPFDPRSYCANVLKEHCQGGTTGLWNSRAGRCFCGSAKADVDLVTREEQVESSVPEDPGTICVHALEGRCADGMMGLWDKEQAYCYCGTASKNAYVSAAGPTTASTLTSRLMPQPLKFPTGISINDYTALQVTLMVLDGRIKSQTELHQVCTGENDLQAYGFKLEIFRKICTPEITMPVAAPEVVKAEEKVYSALWIDNILEKYKNDFSDACNEARVPGRIPSSFDKQWILSQLC